MTNREQDRIEKAHKDYRKNVPYYIYGIDSFRKAIEDNLPQTTGVGALVEKWNKKVYPIHSIENGMRIEFVDDLKKLQQPTQEERCQCKEKYRDEDSRCPDCCKLVD